MAARVGLRTAGLQSTVLIGRPYTIASPRTFASAGRTNGLQIGRIGIPVAEPFSIAWRWDRINQRASAAAAIRGAVARRQKEKACKSEHSERATWRSPRSA